MDKPPKLFEGGPEWEHDRHYVEGEGWETESITGSTAHIWRSEDGVTWWAAWNDGCAGGDDINDAVEYIRSRILAHRDELMRVTGVSLAGAWDEGYRAGVAETHAAQRHDGNSEFTLTPNPYRAPVRVPEEG